MSAGAPPDPAAAERAMAWRASRRGLLEVSMILSGYLAGRAGRMGKGERAAMSDLLDFADADLWELIVAETREPGAAQAPLVRGLRDYARGMHMELAGR